jgi:hypothetical protein
MRSRHCRRVHWFAAGRFLVAIHRGNARDVAPRRRLDFSLRSARRGEQFLTYATVQIVTPGAPCAGQHRMVTARFSLGPVLTVVRVRGSRMDAGIGCDCEQRGRHECVSDDPPIDVMFQNNFFLGALILRALVSGICGVMAITLRCCFCSSPNREPTGASADNAISKARKNSLFLLSSLHTSVIGQGRRWLRVR